jgi:hypothetical protein
MSIEPTIPFFATLLLKMHAGEAWNNEEVQVLQLASVLFKTHRGISTAEHDTEDSAILNSIVCKPVAVPQEQEEAKHEVPKKVKKVKKVEANPVETIKVSETPAAPAAPAAPSNISVSPTPAPIPTAIATVALPIAPAPLEISTKHCMARKVDEKSFLPGTEANKVYEVKQCNRNRAKGELLCPKCEEFYTAFKDKSKLKKKWNGFINEIPLEHLHIVGSKWFTEAYPMGLSEIPTTGVAVTHAVPSDPAQETVLENKAIQEVKWATVKLNGIHYIYNIRDRRIYRADISKEGEEQIQNYEGKYINGEIDPYAEETEEIPD